MYILIIFEKIAGLKNGWCIKPNNTKIQCLQIVLKSVTHYLQQSEHHTILTSQ